MADITSGFPFTIQGQVSDPNGILTPPDKNVNLIVLNNANSPVYKSSTQTLQGSFSFLMPSMITGAYDLQVKYDGSDTFDSVTGDISLNVMPRNTQIGNLHLYPPVIGINSNLTVIADIAAAPITNPSGQPSESLDGVTLNVMIGSKNVGSVVSQNGHIAFNMRPKTASLNFGTYDVSLQFQGDESNSPSILTATNAIQITKSNVVINLQDVGEIRALGATKINGTMISDGAPISGTIVVQTVSGSTSTIVADKKGQFTFNYTPNSIGDDVITFNFEGNDSYDASSTSLNVSVLPASMSITLADYPKSVNVNDKFQIQGTLSETSSMKGIKGLLNVTIHGPDGVDNASVSTSDNGNFAFVVTLLNGGDYHTTIQYDGSGVYDKVSADIGPIAARDVYLK